jgi:hypothetical protein
LTAIYHAFRDNNVDIGQPKRELTVDGVSVKLTPSEQRYWQKF